MRSAVLLLGLLALAACGPAWAPPNAPTRPCDIIDAAAFNAARESGAAVGRARIYESGMVDLSNGPGVSHCATYSSTMRPCRRPNDYVIEYTQADGAVFYVHVPANTEYRFNVRAAPNTCQIILAPAQQ
ncbi:hypothetical protein [Candidatus Viadribacter manganicus]|uniref:hypothetical protein n=1 Tax=Candidatus Viadribacter manganicus TaxID=1759059 RepID=UPI0012E9AFF5|nr:hypothetical protein [Candidatus Viadribacter manganicus]